MGEGADAGCEGGGEGSAGLVLVVEDYLGGGFVRGLGWVCCCLLLLFGRD